MVETVVVDIVVAETMVGTAVATEAETVANSKEARSELLVLHHTAASASDIVACAALEVVALDAAMCWLDPQAADRSASKC